MLYSKQQLYQGTKLFHHIQPFSMNQTRTTAEREGSAMRHDIAVLGGKC